MEQTATFNNMAAQHLKIGSFGEVVARRHLERKGYICLETNFRASTGEIDIIVEKEGVVHFVEVKTVSCVTSHNKVSRETYDGIAKEVPHGTIGNKYGIPVPHETRGPGHEVGRYRPEDNVHREKLRKILNTVQVWLAMNKYAGEWQLDIAAVHLDTENKTGKIRLIENVIVEP